MPLCRVIDARIEDPFAFLRGRQIERDDQTEQVVAAIIDDVRRRGDEALLESARKFDAPGLTSILVTREEIEEADVSARFRDALNLAYNRIYRFHAYQRSTFMNGADQTETMRMWRRDGVGQIIRPLESVGVYVPGGRTVYPSSVLMNAVPAKTAGVEKVFVTTPACQDGTLAPAVLAAMKLAGIERAFKVGGAAAIAALALGTESIPRVAKIVGPGNRFVNEAKRQLWGRVGLDGYAGPSEVCVLVDRTAGIEFAAADLLTQIEHSEDNAAFLVSTDESRLHEILGEADRQLTGALREESMRKALANESCAFIAADLSQALDIVNAIAPEHITVSTEDPESLIDKIKNAGCILLGDYTPESAGDYVLGPSHTLPTRGAARFGSPVNVLDFLKIQSVSNLTKPELDELIPTIEAFGELESFPIHARDATIRRD